MSTDEAMALGLRVKSLRERDGLTQEQLGTLCGMTGMEVSHVECGRREPRLGKLRALADALDVSVDELLGRGGS